MPALGPPTSDRPKVASTGLSTEIFRLRPSSEPVVPSCGAIVVSAALAFCSPRRTPSVTRVPSGIVVISSRSWEKEARVVVWPPWGVMVSRTSPAWISVEVCCSVTSVTVRCMAPALPVSTSAAMTAESWEAVIWALPVSSTCSAFWSWGHTSSRSTIRLSAEIQAAMRSAVVTGYPGQPDTETVVIRRAPSVG